MHGYIHDSLSEIGASPVPFSDYQALHDLSQQNALQYHDENAVIFKLHISL